MTSHRSRFLLFLLFRCTFYATNANNIILADSHCSSCRQNLPETLILDDISPFIVGGTDAPQNAYPWIARTVVPGATCTASLIHSDMILTAAHCQATFASGVLVKPWHFDGRNATFRQVVGQYRFPAYDFDREIITHDLLVLKLNETVPDVRPVVLNDDPNLPALETAPFMTAIGFGLTGFRGSRPEVLQEAPMEYLSRYLCDLYLKDVSNVDPNEGILCAFSRDGTTSVCNGDSGGPLIARQNDTIFQVGLMSFGRQCQSNPYPSGFTRISYYYDWIQQQICYYSSDPPADCPPRPKPHPYQVPIRITIQVCDTMG